MRVRRWTWLGTAAVAAVATSSLLTTGMSTAGAQKASGPPIKLMVIHEKSAGIASPEIPEGAIAAAKAINKAGGVGAQKSPIEIIACDTGNDPNGARTCGQRAVSEGVMAAVSSLTPYSGEYLPVFAQNKIPSIGQITAAVADFTSPAAFPITGGAPVTMAALPRFLADAGAKTVTIARPDIGGVAAALKVFANQGLKPVNQEIENDVPIPPSAPDMAPYVQAALAGGTDGIVVALPAAQALSFTQAALQADPKVKIALISTEPGPVREGLGKQAAGIIQGPALVPVTELKNKTNRQYVKEMKAAGYKDFSGFRNQAWLSVRIFADIADGLPSVSAAAVFDALNTTTNLETGLTPPLQWTTGGVGGVPRIFNGCEMAVALTTKGVAKPVTGKFFDPFTNRECPTP